MIMSLLADTNSLFQTNSREVEALVGRPSSGSMVRFQTNSREVEAASFRSGVVGSLWFQTNSREVEANCSIQ